MLKQSCVLLACCMLPIMSLAEKPRNIMSNVKVGIINNNFNDSLTLQATGSTIFPDCDSTAGNGQGLTLIAVGPSRERVWCAGKDKAGGVKGHYKVSDNNGSCVWQMTHTSMGDNNKKKTGQLALSAKSDSKGTKIHKAVESFSLDDEDNQGHVSCGTNREKSTHMMEFSSKSKQ